MTAEIHLGLHGREREIESVEKKIGLITEKWIGLDNPLTHFNPDHTNPTH